MPLNDEEFGLLQLSIEGILQRLASLGVSLVIERDFYKLKEFLTGAGYLINPTYDPELSNIGPRDYWLHLKDSNGKSIACMGERFFETDDFMRLVISGEIWWAGGLTSNAARREMGYCGLEKFRVVFPRTRISGLISHSGSVWIEPEWRKVGLSLFIPYISRSLSLRNYDIDFNTGFVRPNLYCTPVPKETYGYPNVELCFDAYWPPVSGREQLYVCYISRKECIEKIRELPRGKRYPVPLDHVALGREIEDPLPFGESPFQQRSSAAG